jgi:uncharacterized protein (UPF0128 family)
MLEFEQLFYEGEQNDRNTYCLAKDYVYLPHNDAYIQARMEHNQSAATVLRSNCATTLKAFLEVRKNNNSKLIEELK